MRIFSVFALIVIAFGLVTQSAWKGLLVDKQIEQLSVYMAVKAELPDPANIANTGQWYLLDHISSGVAHFDHVAGKFKPLLASIETYSSGTHSFNINEDAKFHDGTKITAQDLVASLKRLVILKTSTHFPIWDYVEGCENLKLMTDECSGIKIISERRVEIRLKTPVEDFILQMASPETGIWHHGDIDAGSKTLQIKPTKFSGPYFIESKDEKGFSLKRNSYNPISIKFPESPKAIEIKVLKADQVLSSLKTGALDAVVRSHNPYDESKVEELGYDVFSSAPATLIYLHGAGVEKRQAIPRKFIEQLWKDNSDKLILPADNFLPFDPSLSIKREEFLKELPVEIKANRPIRIGVPWTYLSKSFYQFLEKAAEEAQFPIALVSLSPDEWLEGLNTSNRPKDVDFILAIYASSERYPAVQLRYMTGKVRGPKADLKAADVAELSDEKKETLRAYQRELLQAQFAVPLFFSKHQITYKKSLDVGDQPPSDAEVELWRITKK